MKRPALLSTSIILILLSILFTSGCSSSSNSAESRNSSKKTTTTTLPPVSTDTEKILAAFPRAQDINTNAKDTELKIKPTTTTTSTTAPHELCPGVADNINTISPRTSASSSYGLDNTSPYSSEPYVNVGITAYSSPKEASEVANSAKTKIEKCGTVKDLDQGAALKTEIYDSTKIEGAESSSATTQEFIVDGATQSKYYEATASKGRFTVSVITKSGEESIRIAKLIAAKL